MELYLDSADLKEIETGMKLGFLAGLTTTPTFMHREGVTDLDGMIVKLSNIVPVLQIEALGSTADEIVKDAERQLALGLDPTRTVFKIPVSLEGVKACKALRDRGMMVNVHLVYTIQQAYMAMAAGANYVCVLAGRMQDQGYDALKLIRECVDMINYYGSDAKVMFSSVRNTEHVRNAIEMGCHTITVPWKILKTLTDNNFTAVGTQQFFEHTRLVTMRVSDIMSDKNPVVKPHDEVLDAVVQMTQSGFGAVSVVKDDGRLLGIFTDGDLRRQLAQNGKNLMTQKMSAFEFKTPTTIPADALLNEALSIFKDKQIDTIIVTDNEQVVGMLDIQDMAKWDLI